MALRRQLHPVPTQSLPESLRDLVADQPPGHAKLLAVTWATLEQNEKAKLDRVARILRQAKHERWVQDIGIPRWERGQQRLDTAKQRVVKRH